MLASQVSRPLHCLSDQSGTNPFFTYTLKSISGSRFHASFGFFLSYFLSLGFEKNLCCGLFFHKVNQIFTHTSLGKAGF